MLIDVSNHQGAINWAVTAPAVDGAYIKITEGTTYIDPYWSGYRAGLNGGGKPCGAYHFADLTDPVTEANFFADQYLTATWQLRPVLDIESYGATAGWIIAFRDQFRRRVPDPRFRVYTSLSFLTGALDPALWIDSDTDIWMAHYSTTPGWDHPALVLWQNTSAAFVPGIVGSVDADQFMHGWTPAVDITGGTDMLTPEQDRMLAAVHHEVTTRLPSRVPGSTYTDTVFGYAINADMYGFQATQALGQVLALIGAQKGVSAQDIATALAPLVITALPAHLDKLTAADLAAIAKAVADEEARRMAGTPTH